MTILVTGATGLIGAAVVDALAAAGESVAVLTRRPAQVAVGPRVEVRRGDIARSETLAEVFDGVDRMFLFPMAAPSIVDLARAVGVEHVVLLSSMNAAVEEIPDTLHKPMEAALEASGVGWTHLRPGEFAHNKVRLWAEDIKRVRTVRWPDRPGLASAPVHERDVADVAAAALRDPGRHRGRSYILTGPDKLTVREQVDAISAALAEPIDFQPISPAQALAELEARGGWGAAAGRAVLHLDAPHGSNIPTADLEMGDQWVTQPPYTWMLEPATDYATATGRPARSFRGWAEDHADDFR